MEGSLLILLYVIISVAISTQAERKVMAAGQRRVGPNQVGFEGLLQAIADGVKLIQKETVIPSESNKGIFLLAPYIIFFFAQLNWQVQPISPTQMITDLRGAGIQIFITISELSIYGVIFSGWSANSKYPFLGGLRSTAQMISYSVSLSLVQLCIIFLNGSVNLPDIYENQSVVKNIFPLFPVAQLFLVSAIAETNRAPFDQPEAESELVAGFMTEHGAVAFAFFFLGEYANMLTISAFFSIFFFGIFQPTIQQFIMLWVRSSVPRYRFDQLLNLGWLLILPIAIGQIITQPIIVYYQS